MWIPSEPIFWLWIPSQSIFWLRIPSQSILWLRIPLFYFCKFRLCLFSCIITTVSAFFITVTSVSVHFIIINTISVHFLTENTISVHFKQCEYRLSCQGTVEFIPAASEASCRCVLCCVVLSSLKVCRHGWRWEQNNKYMRTSRGKNSDGINKLQVFIEFESRS